MLEDAQYLTAKINAYHLESKSILITGATGLIGTNLLRYFDNLLKSGGLSFSVTAISKSKNNTKFPWHKNINFLHGNLVTNVKELIQEKYEFIFHGASYGQPGKFTKLNMETLMLNGVVTSELLQYMKPGGRFVFFSTSEVYSGSRDFPHEEDHIGSMNLGHERSCYFYGKLFGELILRNNCFDISPIIARVSMCYGPGTKIDDERVLNQFIKSAIELNGITLKDKGSATRVYCYVRDMVEMILNVSFNGKRDTYNLSGNSLISIRDLAILIGNMEGVPVHFNSGDNYFLNAPKNVELSTNRYAEEFGVPKYVPLQEGLTKTIAWQKKNVYRD